MFTIRLLKKKSSAVRIYISLRVINLLPAGLCVAQPCRYCFYSVVQKWVFAPQGRHVAPINVYKGRNVGIQPPKLSNCRILDINFHLRFDSFALFLRNSQRLYAFKFLVWQLSGYKQQSYQHFSAVGAFSHKFTTAPSSETTDWIKKVSGCKNGTDLLYHHTKYGGGCGSRAGCRPKNVMFFVFFICHAFE